MSCGRLQIAPISNQLAFWPVTMWLLGIPEIVRMERNTLLEKGEKNDDIGIVAYTIYI